YMMEQTHIPPTEVSQPDALSGESTYAYTSYSRHALYRTTSVPEALRDSRQKSELLSIGNGQSYTQSFRWISTPYEDESKSQCNATTGQTPTSINDITHSPTSSPHLDNYLRVAATPHQNSMSQSVFADVRCKFDEMLTASSSSGVCDPNVYHLSYFTSPTQTQSYTAAQSSVMVLLAKGASSESSSTTMLNQRPKPECWEHGCNGRRFSTSSNLLRHRREKLGTAPKYDCPKCGAEFTRATARNGHLAHEKCMKTRDRAEGSSYVLASHVGTDSSKPASSEASNHSTVVFADKGERHQIKG
ncbi:hypothetical protein LTR17_023626, partial [Elasticomyces elasticus]